MVQGRLASAFGNMKRERERRLLEEMTKLYSKGLGGNGIGFYRPINNADLKNKIPTYQKFTRRPASIELNIDVDLDGVLVP